MHHSKKVATIVTIPPEMHPPAPGEKNIAVAVELDGFQTVVVTETLKPK